MPLRLSDSSVMPILRIDFHENIQRKVQTNIMVIPKGYQDFLASEITESSKELSRFHVIPVPMESSVSYRTGTSKGPWAILEASQQLKAWDGQSEPLSLGIHTSESVDCTGNAEEILSYIELSVKNSLELNAIPVILGGEHTVTLGALRALKKHCGDNQAFGSEQSCADSSASGTTSSAAALACPPFGIIQIDAHADLRNEYEGTPYSHACVMRRAVDDLGLPLFQLGIRALSSEEVRVRQERKIGYIDAREIHMKGIQGVANKLLPDSFPEKIYISIDVDGLDPSVIRATGTPVPGGIGWYDTLTLLEQCIAGRSVVGFDVVELAPFANDHASDFAAAQLTYCVMGMIQRAKEVKKTQAST